MKRRAIVIVVLSVTAVVLLSSVLVFTVFTPKDASALGADSSTSSSDSDTTVDNDDTDDQDTNTYNPSTDGNNNNTDPVITENPIDEEPFVPATEMDLEPSSITVFVNKEHALPKSYKPEDLVTPNIYFDLTYYDERTLMRKEAADAIELLFQAAEKDGYRLAGISGYRSYARQYKIFTDNIVKKGKVHTLKYSAVPGTSEHQTGLVMDLSCSSLDYDLDDGFADTPEGKWLADNSYRFGYIIRYPKGKADITGYAYEPWHIRYVGKALATYLYENDLTLDEYYKYTPSKDFNFEALYADLINYRPSVTPVPVSGSGIIIGENGEIIDEGPDGAAPTGGATITPTGAAGEDVTVTPKPTVAPTPSPTITPTPTPTITPELTPGLTPTPPMTETPTPAVIG